MTSSLRQLYHDGRLSQYLLWLACAGSVAGLLFARALVAISPAVGVAAALLNPQLGTALRQHLRNGAAWRAAALYLLLLGSVFYTSQWAMWRHESYRLLPWLAVPFAFGVAVPLSRGQRRAIAGFFIFGVALIGLATVRKYLLDPSAANNMFSRSQNLPSVTRIFHIHFSLMLALAFYGAILLRRESGLGSRLRFALLLAGIAAFISLHVLAYRTGLLVLYAVMLLDVLALLLRRKVILGLALLLVLGLTPWLAYSSLSSVRMRVGATLYDLQQFERGGNLNELSLSKRLAAWQSALLVARQHPWLGVGVADTEAAMMDQYNWYDYGISPENRVMIHNQYLHFLVGGGVLGLSMWLLLLGWPLVQPGLRRNPYIRHFLLIQATAMLVDSLLEVQIGYNLFVFGYGFLVVTAERQRLTPAAAA